MNPALLKILLAVGIILFMVFIGNGRQEMQFNDELQYLRDSAQQLQRLQGFGLKEQRHMEHWLYADTFKYDTIKK